MTTIIRSFTLLLIVASATQGAEPVAKQFLRYIYGADGIEIANVCHSSDDVWMLRGEKNASALAILDTLKIASKPTSIASGLIGKDIYFVETRDGKVDPAFTLDGVYRMHRQLVLRFIFAALTHDHNMMDRLATDPSKVKFVGPKDAPPPGEMGQYESIIELMPVVRSSRPAEDAKSRTVTYRVPISEEALSLTLLKEGGLWKIDTSKTVRVPLEFFFRENLSGKRAVR